MEPRTYIQKCKNGKTRVYKGKLPPIENGPYEEWGAKEVRLTQGSQSDFPWWVVSCSVSSVLALVCGVLVYFYFWG